VLLVRVGARVSVLLVLEVLVRVIWIERACRRVGHALIIPSLLPQRPT